FLEVLSRYIQDNLLEYQNNGKKYEFSFDIKNYNDSLHVVFQYNKAGKIGITDVHSFQIFLNEINIEASKSHLNYTTILDTNSLFFSKKLLPYLHSYEWALRKLIYLLAPTYFDNWTKDSIPDEMISAVKGKQKQAIGKYDLENLLQWIDLYDFEEYLFGENYLFISTGNEKNIVRYKEIIVEELLNLFRETDDLSLSDPFSLWSEVFSKYMYVDLEEIRKDMELIREGRNIVSHNKEIKYSLYKDLIKNLKKYVKQLNEAFKKILIGEIADEKLFDMTNDFEAYIGNHYSNINLPNATKLLTSLSAMTVLNTDSTKKMMETIGPALSVQRAVMQNIDTEGFRRATEGMKQSLSAMTVLNADSTKKMMETISSALSAQRAVMQNIDTEGFRRATEGMKQSLSAMTVLNTDSTKKMMETIGPALSAQRAVMQNIDTEEFRRATERMKQSLSPKQALKSDYKIADDIEDSNK
ncbi:TPA: hypothetical protein IWI92_001609, partial [Enterococcus faecium]|nr:hypothetical protein [Enterococcus faecium]